MALAEALKALREHWENVLAGLDDQSRADLVLLVGKYDSADRRTALPLIKFLGKKLDAAHPVRRALAVDSISMGRPNSAVLEDERVEFEAFVADLAVQNAKEALLAAPALSPEDVRQRGRDPSGPGLIRLPAPDGTARLPSFQFDASGAPRPIVIEINGLLDAEADPWGVASWWLERNAWLGETPADMLDSLPAERLRALALAVIEDGD